MSLQKIQHYSRLVHFPKEFGLLLVLFLVVHALLFNINTAEWGDSYRILRASEYLKSGSYPPDEKRPPLLSLVIATHPVTIDPVTYGRVVLFAFSLGAFTLFYFLAKTYIKDTFWLTWATLAFLFNNVYLYWSIRVMADVPFSFFVLLALYLFSKWYATQKNPLLFWLGIVCGLAILTRFEGYLLTFALCAGVALKDFKLDLRRLVPRLWVLVGLALVVAPYLVYRNPFTSSYFEEPGNRVYDFNMLAIYLLSLIAITGVPVLAYFALGLKLTRKFIVSNIPQVLFMGLELVLILSWPAAVPRLFVPIIPLLVIFLAVALGRYFEAAPTKHVLVPLGVMFFLLTTYALGQYNYKLQFLLLDKKLFVFSMVLQLVIVFSLLLKKKLIFGGVSILTMIIWSYAAIAIHKDIFISVKSAADYAGRNLTGNIAYNDVSSVSDWYLNYQYKNPNRRGFYYNTEKKANLEETPLKAAGIDYLLITNEHNTTMTLDIKKRPYLNELQIFEYNVNGRNFVSRLVEVL